MLQELPLFESDQHQPADMWTPRLPATPGWCQVEQKWAGPAMLYWNCRFISRIKVSPMAQQVKNPPVMQETWVWSLGWEDPLEKEMAPHSSTLAWKIPWTEEPGRLQSTGLQRVGLDWATSLSLFWCYPLFYNFSSFFMFQLTKYMLGSTNVPQPTKIWKTLFSKRHFGINLCGVCSID